MAKLDEAMKGAVQDGMVLGISMAIDCLDAAKPNVSTENQTWDSAIAVLNNVRAEYQASIATPSDKEGGE